MQITACANFSTTISNEGMPIAPTVAACGPEETSRHVRYAVAIGVKADILKTLIARGPQLSQNSAERDVGKRQIFVAMTRSKFLRRRAFYLFRGSLAQHRSEYVIPQRCADTVVSRCELMMTSVVLEQS
jgi:hypothetical protein